jgi:hypothetical protein
MRQRGDRRWVTHTTRMSRAFSGTCQCLVAIGLRSGWSVLAEQFSVIALDTIQGHGLSLPPWTCFILTHLEYPKA